MRGRQSVPSADWPAGLLVTWADSAGREISILSGIEGEIGGTEILGSVDVRGHVATVSENDVTSTRIAVWREATEGLPCSKYVLTTTGLTADEFASVIEGVR